MKSQFLKILNVNIFVSQAAKILKVKKSVSQLVKHSMNANPSLVTDCVHRWKMKQNSTEEEIKSPSINKFQSVKAV